MSDRDHKEGQAAHPVGFLQAPIDTGSVQVFGADPRHYQVGFTYRNYRGEVSERVVIPLQLGFGCNEWHPVPQYLLKAFDCEKKAERWFAMNDIVGWKAAPLL